ncbi:lipin [Angomonas deanei]|uniref:LNS2 (Lipin/Ned1/Smp2), putative n=1 Tax=Angomonas deanei TaxID=59799 RepID=A0A7G2CKT3_9TRYP|nr:lipin [Angomonas deanei]CAD2220029.1 LNS2 (Lipin/Ned1/Smp2), putative [Angomonas deanei]|eukprot:EPY21603.1 lipin [Angomonas deanei]
MKMWSRADKIVQLEVNGVMTRAVMKLASDGEAYWLQPNYPLHGGTAGQQEKRPAETRQAEGATDAPRTSTTAKPNEADPSSLPTKGKKVNFDASSMQAEHKPTTAERLHSANNLIQAVNAFSNSKKRVSRTLLSNDSFLQQQAAKEGIHAEEDDGGDGEEGDDREPSDGDAFSEEDERLKEDILLAEKKLAEKGEDFIMTETPAAAPAEWKEDDDSVEDDDQYYLAPIDADDALYMNEDAPYENSSGSVFVAVASTELDGGDGNLIDEMGSIGSVDDIRPSPKIATHPPGTSSSNSTDAMAFNAADSYFVKTLVPSPEDLQKLNLKPGHNHVRYIIWKNSGVTNTSFDASPTEMEEVDPSGKKTDYLKSNTQEEHTNYVCISSSIFLWSEEDKIIISDVDGTITKSDMWGHWYIGVGRGNDWTHPGVASLYRKIVRNGYKIVYLTARSVTQINATKDYLFNQIKQEESSYFTGEGANNATSSNNSLPLGPVLTVPQKFFTALTKEVMKKSHIFKIACLTSLMNCFPPEVKKPFFAGFGNRINDVISYDAVKVSTHRIFIIDEKSVLHCCKVKHSYTDLAHLVNEIFPPLVKTIHTGTYTSTNPLDTSSLAPLTRLGSDSSSISVQNERDHHLTKNFSLADNLFNSSSSSSSASSVTGDEVAPSARVAAPQAPRRTQVPVDSDFNSFNYWRVDPTTLVEDRSGHHKEATKSSSTKGASDGRRESNTKQNSGSYKGGTPPLERGKEGAEELTPVKGKAASAGSTISVSPLPKDPKTSQNSNNNNKGGFFSFGFNRGKTNKSDLEMKDEKYFQSRKYTHPDYLPLSVTVPDPDEKTETPATATNATPNAAAANSGGWAFWKKRSSNTVPVSAQTSTEEFKKEEEVEHPLAAPSVTNQDKQV